MRIFRLTMLVIVILAWPAFPETAFADPPTASHLLVDSLSEPLALESLSPRFSWIITDPDRDETQSAYRILVASSRTILDRNEGDLWDSGKVDSPTSTHVEYDGKPLGARNRCWWKVRVWDRAGTPGAYSNASFFETGLQETGWKARFIGHSRAIGNVYSYLRKRFHVPSPVTCARIYLSAHDDYRLFINGTFVGRGPAPADPYDSCQYNAWDISSLVKPGENVVAVIAHYHGFGVGCGVRGTSALIAQAEIECGDGKRIVVTSDETWKLLANTPWEESSFSRGPAYARATSVEDYNARREIPGWKEEAFDDSEWECAQVVEPGYRLKAQTVPVEAVDRVLEPAGIESPVPGIFLVDFGMNYTGWPVLKITGAKPDQRIRIWYAEEKDGNRIVRNGNGVTHYYDQYWCKGTPEETWEPDTKYNGFRYVEVEGYPGLLTRDKIRLKYTHTAPERKGAFRCSSERINEIYRICVRTQTNCCQGILVDGPQREQTQYAADAVIQGMNLFYNFGFTGLHRKFLYDLVDSARVPGLLCSNHPSEKVSFIPEWTLHWPIGLWNQYLFHGDVELLRDLYPTLQAMAALFGRYVSAETGLLAGVPGLALSDHPLSEMDMDGASLTPQNCLYFRMLVIAAEVADLVGKEEDSARYEAASARMREAINRHLFDGHARYRDCSGSTAFHALSSVFPLYFGIVPEDRVGAVLDHVVGKGFEPSVYGGFYLCETLYRFDRDRHMFELLIQNDRQWGKMLSLGATTTWEAWVTGGSRCHAWSAYPMKFLLSGVAGIEPLTPGFATFRIRPRIEGDLRFAEGAVPTVKGRIVSSWYKTRNGLCLKVEIPVNTRAEVHLPLPGPHGFEVTEGGRSLWKENRFVEGVQGISFLGRDKERISFHVGSGVYAFETLGCRE